MNPQRKTWIAFGSFFLVMAIIACSCPISPIIPTTPTETTEPEPTVAISVGSGTVTSADAGMVTSDTGASIAIPAGAVPPNDDGTVGSMIFSISEDTTAEPPLPSGLATAGPLVNLTPEGFVFNQPVTVSLPISSGVDLSSVLGAAYLNVSSGDWTLIPGSVDTSTRTLVFTTTHFSTYTTYRTQQEAADATGGYLDVAIPTGHTDYAGPDAQYISNPINYHGVCITSVVYDDPNVSTWWLPPLDFSIVVSDYWGGIGPRVTQGPVWLPAGTYQLDEFVGQAEKNPGDPLYIPHEYFISRSYGTLILAPGQTERIDYPNVSMASYESDGWVLGRPNCWRSTTTSVGVGDLQITLNWETQADIDLHVIEPGGEEIYWNHISSAAGGNLDRDNKCSNYEQGRPENIFWNIPPYGWYTVKVVYYTSSYPEEICSEGPVNFSVRICIRGVCENPIGGTVNSPGDEVEVTQFEYPGD